MRFENGDCDPRSPRPRDFTKVIVMIPFARNQLPKGVTPGTKMATPGTKNGDSSRNGEWNQKWRQSLVCRFLLCIDRARRVLTAMLRARLRARVHAPLRTSACRIWAMLTPRAIRQGATPAHPLTMPH